MRFIIAVLMVLFFLSFYNFKLKAQAIICIPYGIPAVMDGQITAGEWADADSIQIALNATQNVTVKFKHDSLNLYLVYRNYLESAFRFPEIVLDVNNDKSTAWQNDDWWFHVSATDCESNGTPSVYTNCLAVQQDWEGVPNMAQGPPITDTIEMRISLAKVGINLSMNPVIGLAFDVSNTVTVWSWPLNANINNPYTWATAVFCVATADISQAELIPTIFGYPNPANSDFHIRLSKNYADATLVLSNTLGEIIHQFKLNSKSEILFSRDRLSNGVYVVQLKKGNNILATEKIILIN